MKTLELHIGLQSNLQAQIARIACTSESVHIVHAEGHIQFKFRRCQVCIPC